MGPAPLPSRVNWPPAYNAGPVPESYTASALIDGRSSNGPVTGPVGSATQPLASSRPIHVRLSLLIALFSPATCNRGPVPLSYTTMSPRMPTLVGRVPPAFVHCVPLQRAKLRKRPGVAL